MWIKPGQHGTSARSPSGHLLYLTQAAIRQSKVRPQRGTTSQPPQRRYVHACDPWKNGP
jgi:hypothetical protein